MVNPFTVCIFRTITVRCGAYTLMGLRERSPQSLPPVPASPSHSSRDRSLVFLLSVPVLSGHDEMVIYSSILLTPRLRLPSPCGGQSPAWGDRDAPLCRLGFLSGPSARPRAGPPPRACQHPANTGKVCLPETMFLSAPCFFRGLLCLSYAGHACSHCGRLCKWERFPLGSELLLRSTRRILLCA